MLFRSESSRVEPEFLYGGTELVVRGTLRASGAEFRFPDRSGGVVVAGGRAELADVDGVLVPGGFGLSEPARDWPLLDPDVLAVPLLGFDRHGYRIGYGAGFYDRTLQRLRALKTVIAASYCFSVQEFAAIPHDENDQRLDWIVTDKDASRVSP